MLSAILVEPGQLELEEIPEPQPGPGEVVLRVASALTCGADLRAWRSGAGAPCPLGHEYSGIVARVGPGVPGFREGDAVMTAHTAPCGECFPCQRNQANLCEALEAGMAVGGFAEFVRVSAPIVRQNMFPKPATMSFAEAAFLEPLASVVQGLQSVPVAPGDTVVILGSGTIGLLYLMTLQALGRPRRIIMAGRGRDRLELAAGLGADRVVDAERESVIEVVRDLTGGLGAEVVLECAGQLETWSQMLDLTRRGSHIMLFGGCPSGIPVELDTTRLHYDQIGLVGTCHFTPQAVRSAYELLSGDEVRPARILSGTFPLEELPQVFQKLDRGQGLKYEILPPTHKEPVK